MNALEFNGLLHSGEARLTDATKQRNLAEYEGFLEIDEQLLNDLLIATKTLLTHIINFEKKNS